MEDFEYQALVSLRDKVWTEIMGGKSQNWSYGNCKFIAKRIRDVVGENALHERTLKRFIDDLEKTKKSDGKAKDVLLYFLNKKQWVYSELIDPSLYQLYLQDFQQVSLPHQPSIVYAGEYAIYLKEGNLVKTQGSVVIYDDGKATLYAGKELFHGQVEKKNSNLHFRFENDVESIYMIIRVGITLEKDYLNALVGVYIAVSSENSSPFSELIVLVKKGTEKLNDTVQRVQNVFDTIGENHEIKVNKKLSRLLDIDIPIEKSYTGKNKAIKHLSGYWLAYTVGMDGTELYQSILVIKGKNTLSYQGVKTSYSSGFIQIHGESIFIYMSGTRKAFISTSSMYRDWTTIKELVGTYATVNAETHQPSMGCVILRKAPSSISNDFKPQIYFKGTEEYTQYVDIAKRLRHFVLNFGILENAYEDSLDYKSKPSSSQELGNQEVSFTHSKNENLPLVFIQGGTFEMGDVLDDRESDNEIPHYVVLDGFYLAQYPITIKEFDEFCIATNRPLLPDFGWGRDNNPVVDVSWYDAIEYCNWLTIRHGFEPVYQIISDQQVLCNWQAKGFRLPTEAEWEYAAREGGKLIRFGNGSPVADPQKLNFDGQSKDVKPFAFRGENRNKTVQVGSLNNPNSLGLYDMSGNVWEWCWDYYKATIPEGQQNPRGPETGHEKVIRGGSWNNAAASLRCSCRDYKPPEFRRRNIGFRIARSS